MHPALVSLMPNPFVRLFAGPYIAGDSVEVAVDTARHLHQQRRIASTLDLLGEEAGDQAQIDQAVALYRSLIDAIASAKGLPSGRPRPTVSLKPSSFTVTHRDARGNLSAQTDLSRAYESIAGLARHARDRGIGLTIDMEDHAWVDFTLDAYRRLLDEGLSNVGTVLQSMLFRTKEDVQSFDGRARIRLVIGIYREPASIAFTVKRDMKRKLVEYAEDLLDRGVYVEYGTHDEEYIHRFLREVAMDREVKPDRFEIQMLLGVPRARLQDALTSGDWFRRQAEGDGAGASVRALGDGVLTRLYVPFALSWDQAVAYCRRRLKENPNIVWYGLRNLVGA